MEPLPLPLSFYIPRKEMPQINHPNKLISWLLKKKIEVVTHWHVHPKVVQPHQHIILDPKKSSHIPLSKLHIPLIASADFYIIDGNHRWLKSLNLNERVNIIQFDKYFGEALVLLQDYPKVQYEGGEE